MRRRMLLTITGLAILGLISGLFIYGPTKERDMDSRKSVARAAEPTAVTGPVDAPRQDRIETVTFAMG
jgi:hypothetical protein